MRVTLVQNDIVWEHPEANLLYYDSLLAGLTGKTDLVLLPELCTTGFSMKTAELAESDTDRTITTLSQMAVNYNMAIAGSFIGLASNGKGSYNRGFFLYPDGRRDFSNKRHLFRMGEETAHFLPGNDRTIISYRGWNIRLLICYDLRFPVWSRNIDNGYDLLLVCANWPAPRRHVWSSLLTARALENMSYVCGVNRVGTDGEGLSYSGDSCLIDAYGNALTTMQPDLVQVETVDIDLESLHRFRDKFPAWMDADRFQLIEEG
jgi:predicted amidohydrolase